MCGGSAPLASNAASCSALSVPASPGGRTLRKPPASLVPYGWTAAVAVAVVAKASADASAARATRILTARDPNRGRSRSAPVGPGSAALDPRLQLLQGRREDVLADPV